ncbi:MAG: proton-conducting transporter membrane subunit, partial [Candidatus Neomarinimicrobiota bacterium]
MGWLEQNLLTLTIFLPTVGAAAILLLKNDQQQLIRQVALTASLITFVLSYLLFKEFQTSAAFQFVVMVPWISNYGISYHVGIDGISLLLVMLTTFMAPVTILSAFDTIHERVKGFMVALLLMETGLLGVFASLDLFLFYIFWEAMLIPMYFIIGIWGGPNRLYASIKFVLFTMLGSLLMLVAIIALYSEGEAQLGRYTTNYLDLVNLNLSTVAQTWMFLAFGLSFAIK